MIRLPAAAVLAGLLWSVVDTAYAQINFSNLLETRVGRDPDEMVLDLPANRLTYFDQFNLDYYRDELSLGLRFEAYSASEDRDLAYREFVHRYAAWNSEWIDARVGNFNAMFGRGLVLRSFELTGVVREENGQQFGDSRDLDGVRLRLHRGPHELVALSGKPRLANDPPGDDRSNRGTVAGAMASTQVATGVRLGGEYLRLDDQDSMAPSTSEVGGGFVLLGLDPWLRRGGIERLSLDTFVEMARAHGLTFSPGESSSKLAPDRGRGLYVAQSATLHDLGLQGLHLGASWEYKDYQNFLLLGGVNEPPQLVREHSYVLLNRNTHIVDTMQEEGYQFESRVDYRRLATLVLNWSRAENRYLGALPNDPPRPARFREFYAEFTARSHGISVSGFAGNSQDGAKLVFDRRTYGVYTVVPLRGPHSLEVEYEQLTGVEVRRSPAFPDADFKDNYLAVSYAWAGIFSLTAVRETTDNPDEPGAPEPVNGGVPRRSFESLSGSLRLGSHHEIVAFWGERRGGLQCTAGTCYVVPAFDGVLMQVLSRF